MSEPWCVERGEPEYPPTLPELSDPPERIWGLGDRELLARIEPNDAVTIVGARRSGAYGVGIANELGRDLASAGVVVVSGMALGCDAAALSGAVDAGKPALAVLGSGPDVPYPRRHRDLHGRILEAGGAVIARREPGAPPEKWAFPQRNGIMAALAALTIVVEGREASGTRLTAEEVERLGRTLGAVPGPVSSPLSELPNGLIKDGAEVIRDARDALDLLCGVGVAHAGPRGGPPIEDGLAVVLDQVEGGRRECDSIAAALGLDGQEAAVRLARLELLGYVRGDEFGRFERSALRPPRG